MLICIVNKAARRFRGVVFKLIGMDIAGKPDVLTAIREMLMILSVRVSGCIICIVLNMSHQRFEDTVTR